jgi:hypothetical protein
MVKAVLLGSVNRIKWSWGRYVVIAVVGFEFLLDLICSFPIVQIQQFGQGQVFKDRAVGMTGDDRVYPAIRKPGWVGETGGGTRLEGRATPRF